MTEELKPCPFCGGEPSAPVGRAVGSVTYGKTIPKCTNPACYMGDSIARKDPLAFDYVAAWNTRADAEAATLRAKLVVEAEKMRDHYHARACEIADERDSAKDALTQARADLEAEMAAHGRFVVKAALEQDTLRQRLEASFSALGETTADYNRVFLEADDRRIERDQARADLEAMTQDRDRANALIHVAMDERDQARAEAESLRELRSVSAHAATQRRADRAEAALREIESKIWKVDYGSPEYQRIIDAYFTTQQTKDTDQ